jgi:hypothetical protein
MSRPSINPLTADWRGGNNPEVSFNTPKAVPSLAQAALLPSFALWMAFVGGDDIFEEIGIPARKGGADRG